ncbi:MAG: hypothetical protein HOO86_11025 [Bacteroidales bacterium]|nr:hypothetical protein [Bacteroidales bacterium]
MKKILFLFAILLVVMGSSCSKSTDKPDENQNTEFKFVSLASQDTTLPVNGITTVEATATGSGLTYTWTASYGSFIGSGKSVKWTVCHADRFTVTCEVKDNMGHSDTKTVSINVH